MPVVERLGEDAIAADVDVDAHPAVARRDIGSIDLERGLDDPDVGCVRLDRLDGGSSAMGRMRERANWSQPGLGAARPRA